MSVGVTVGKFNPPHLGHLYMLFLCMAFVGLYRWVMAAKEQTT